MKSEAAVEFRAKVSPHCLWELHLSRCLAVEKNVGKACKCQSILRQQSPIIWVILPRVKMRNKITFQLHLPANFNPKQDTWCLFETSKDISGKQKMNGSRLVLLLVFVKNHWNVRIQSKSRRMESTSQVVVFGCQFFTACFYNGP